LVILLHGVGSSAHAMKPAADEISLGLGHAAVVTLNGIEPFDLRGSGFQWFSVAGVTDANRARRVAEALPRVEAMIESECARANVSRERTAVVGFSQGAIMALHLAASLQRPPTAIVSWAGRIAPPQQVLGRLSPTTKSRSRQRLGDTTVQPKNVVFPTNKRLLDGRRGGVRSVHESELTKNAGRWRPFGSPADRS
jgi:predicted esterase